MTNQENDMRDDKISKSALSSELPKGISLPGAPAAYSFDRFARIPESARITPEQYLLDDVKRSDPAVSVVHMNESRTVQIASDQKHTLFTYGLGGCTAALIISRKPDGSSIATMTHYDPHYRQLHPVLIMQDTSESHTNLPEGTKHTMIIVSPGHYVETDDEKAERKVKDELLVSSLIDAAKRGLGQDIETKILPYSEGSRIGRSRGFIVRFNPGTETPEVTALGIGILGWG